MNARREWVSLLGILGAAGAALGQGDFVWVRPAAQGNGNWNSTANWVGESSYMPDDPDERAIFNHPSTNGMPIQNANMTDGLGQLRFNHAGWTVYGTDPLRFNSIQYYQSLAIEARAQSGAGTITLHPPLVFLNARQVIATDSGAVLQLAGGVSGSFAPIIGSLSPGSLDTGAVRLNAQSFVNDAFTVRQGTLLVAHSAGLGASSAAVTLGDTGTAANAQMALLTDTNGVTVTKNIVVQNFGSSAVLGANHTSGSSTFSGSITVNRSTLLRSEGGTVTFSGQISGAGALTVTGSGTVVLSGPNTFTAPLTVGSGTLRLGADNALPVGATVSVAPLDGAWLDLNGHSATIGVLSGGASGAGITLGSGALTVQSGSFNGPISESGSLTKSGSGTLTLGGNNTYGGGTSINGGTLRLGSSAALPSGGAVTLANAAGVTLDLDGHSPTIGALNGGGPLGGNITLGNGTLTVQGGSYTGTISGAGGLVKSGGGTLTLYGDNSHGGGTTINGGTLRLGAGGALPASGDVTLANTAGATLDLNGFSLSVGALNGGGPQGGNVTLGGGTLAVQSGSYTGAISGAGGLTKSGSGTLTLAGNNTYEGDTTISAGVLRLGSSSALPAGGVVSLANAPGAALDLNGHSAAIGTLNGGGPGGGHITLGAGQLTVGDGSYAGEISGAGGLVKSGSGTLTLSGTNTYTGGTTVNGGTLVAAKASALPMWGSVTIANAPQTVLHVQELARIGNLSGGGPMGGEVAMAGSAAVHVRGGSFGGQITGSGTLIKSGLDLLVLISDQSNEASTLVIQEGTVQLGMGGTAGSWAGAIQNHGTLAVSRSDDHTMTQAISGSGGLQKLGSGRLTLTGDLGYTGETVVQQGTLRINTDRGPAGLVRVEPSGAASATLSGSGRIRGSVSVAESGVLAPGGSIGTMTVDGNVGIEGTLQIELAGAECDMLNVGGALDISAATLSFSPTYPLTAPVYVFASYGSLVGEFAQIKKMPAGMWIDYNYGGANQIALVPEPGAAALIGLGGVIALALRRRRGCSEPRGEMAEPLE